ncbi:hypothetical protein MLD38_020731 [Melastoma candidum]|uniref:Uncharacterized protein n=1 Tax=Melastoma candidum TaxID=119954 RepID=A0ACB9QLY5_9MYRT|nr:hypothetical protein MLD38_020731 [Melastoma candidum]
MTSHPPGTTDQGPGNDGREKGDASDTNDNRYGHSSQTGEEFSEEFLRDRIGGIKRVNVLPAVDRVEGCHYENARGPFDFERCNDTDCGTSSSAFFNSPVVRNPFQSPFSLDRVTYSGGFGQDEANLGEAVSEPLATLFSPSESPQSCKLKFLCSYGGRILPRPSDGRLRYVGGETRIISIRRNVSWEELVRKTSAICKQPHMIKYQLPGEDLDALISVCSDEDLQNLIEEFCELERNGNSQRLRIFLISLSECESPRSFEVGSEQQHDINYQYVVAVNGMLDPSPQKSVKAANQAFQLGGSSSNHSPGCGRSRRDSPMYLQAIDGREYSPSSHMRPTLASPSHVQSEIIGSSPANALGDWTHYYVSNEVGPSFPASLHVVANLSAEDGPVNSDRSFQKLFPSAREHGLIKRTISNEKRVIPRDNLAINLDDQASCFGKSVERDTPNYRIVHSRSDSQLPEYSNGGASSAEEGHVACPVNISAESLPLLVYPSPSHEWCIKSQDINKAENHDTRKVTVTNETATSREDDDSTSSLVDAKPADSYRENGKVSAADMIPENNSSSYQLGIPLNESAANNAIPDDNRSVDRVPRYRISAISSAIEECLRETDAGNIVVQRDHTFETNPENGNSTAHDERRDQGTIKRLVVDASSPFSPNCIIPRKQDGPEPSGSNVSSQKDLEGTVTPDTTDLEDAKSDDHDDGEDLISNAVMAEIEAGIYGLQIIKNADLEEQRELGSGTFGTVYHGKWRGTDVAIKRIKKSCFAGRLSEQERITNDFWREAKILSNLHHPNVVAFYGVVPDGPGGTLSTVTEFMVNGSLRQNLVRNSRLLDRRKKLMIAMDAAFGMEYLHLKNIVHFDLKCDNFLVNLKDPRRPVCKVGDFGLSRIKQNTLVSGGIRGTLPWMAPELLNGTNDRVSEKVDIYSFGIAMWEMLTGEEPYANMHCGAIIGGIVNNNLRPPIPERCDVGWRRLMEECWSTDPCSRPSFTEITQRLQEMLKTVQLKRDPSLEKPK